jgi:hypothetical protein
MAISIGVSLLSSLLAPKPKKVANDNTPTSAFGADIPRIFGIARVPTTLIYASKVKQRKKGKGGGFGKGNNKKYFGNFAVVVGEGERNFNSYISNSGSGRLTLRRIFLNDKIWVDYTAQATPDLIKDTQRREEFFEFYPGSMAQGQDPTLVAQLGAANVSSYRGLSYVVFSNLELTDYGGNYPTVKIEVVADLAPTFEVITRDIMYRVGRKQGRPLCEFSDYTIATIPPSITIDGYILSQDVSDYRSEMANVMQVFRRMAVQLPNAWRFGTANPLTSPANNRATQPSWVFVSSIGHVNPSAQTMLAGASTVMYRVPQPYAHEYKDADKFPTEMHFSYIQPRLDFEREVVVASRASQGLGDTTSISMNAVIQNRTTASAIAVYLIREGWNRVNHINYSTASTPLLGTMASLDVVNTPLVMNTKIETGADGRSNVTSVITGSANAENIIENPITINTYTNTTSGPENIIWTEGPSQDNGTTKSALVMVAPRVGVLDLMSKDSGATYVDVGTALSANSYKVPITGTFKHTHGFGVIDTATELTIVVPESVQLTSITTEQLWTKTRNLMYLENYGMICFRTATATAANTYRLTGILWGVDGTDQDQQPSFDFPTFGWLMTAAPYTVQLPANVGAIVQLGLFDEAGIVLSTYQRRLRNANQMPRPPVSSYVTMQDNGDLLLRWSNGTSQTTSTPSLLFEDNVSTATSHNIHVYFYSRITGSFIQVLGPTTVASGTNSHTFTVGDQSTWTSPTTGLPFPLADMCFVVTANNGLGVTESLIPSLGGGIAPAPSTSAAHVTVRRIP